MDFCRDVGTCPLISFASSKSSHDVSTLLQLSLADLTRSPLVCPMSWIPPNPVPVLCEGRWTKAPASPGPRSGVTGPLLFFGHRAGHVVR